MNGFQWGGRPFPTQVGRRTWSLICISVLIGGVTVPQATSAQNTFGPTDPFASIDGEPVFVGELNWLLIERLKAGDLRGASVKLQRAAANMIVRQHLALRTMREQGGDALQGILDREWKAFRDELKRLGLSLDAYCRERQTDPRSVRVMRDWETAWRTYLKSRLTDDNLERFYQAHRDRYAPTRWQVSHIFLPVDADVDGSTEIARSRMKRILAELESVAATGGERAERFAELARSESDGGSAADGGKLGWVSQSGDLPNRVMEAIRTTSAGHLTDPIVTDRGIHLVLVRDRRTENVPFDQLPDLARLRRDAADALLENLIQQQSDAQIRWLIDALEPPAR